jgi:hypothetical protein
MRAHATSLHRPSLLRSVLAVLCAGLVLLLGAAGVNAELHAQLHAGHDWPVADHGVCHGDHDHGGVTKGGVHHHDEAGCVVDLFAHGVAAAVEQPHVKAATEVGVELLQTVADTATPTKTAGWLPPPCGPPLK